LPTDRDTFGIVQGVDKDMMDLVIETELDSGLTAELPDAIRLTARQFTGGPELVHWLVSLSAATLPLIAKVIIEQIRANKHVRIVLKDRTSGANLDIRGVSDKKGAEIVERYLQDILRTAPTKK
jgi:hypothetical protein